MHLQFIDRMSILKEKDHLFGNIGVLEAYLDT